MFICFRMRGLYCFAPNHSTPTWTRILFLSSSDTSNTFAWQCIYIRTKKTHVKQVKGKDKYAGTHACRHKHPHAPTDTRTQRHARTHTHTTLPTWTSGLNVHSHNGVPNKYAKTEQQCKSVRQAQKTYTVAKSHRHLIPISKEEISMEY